jgi:hypothetical protein
MAPVVASDYRFGIFWSLCCLFFLALRLLITTLVSSNFSYIVKAHLHNLKKLTEYEGKP